MFEIFLSDDEGILHTNTWLSFVDSAIVHVAKTRTEGLILSFDEEFRKIPGLRVIGKY